MEVIQHFSPTSKVWVYQAKRAMTDDEKTDISSLLTHFMAQWNSHGSPVDGTFQLVHNQFILLIASEESGVSGCSIDSSVKIIREIEDRFHLGLLDRTRVSYLANEEVKTIPFTAIKNEITTGLLRKDSLIFNNAVATLGEFENSWMIKAENSWMSRYF